MSRVDSGYTTPDGLRLYYEILQTNGDENGFDIFIGSDSKFPYIHQPEPFIPDRSLTYEENAIKLCEEFSNMPKQNGDSNVKPLDERLMTIEGNIDYLLLLSE